MGARVLVRADAGPRVGIGHVMRCLSLADELAARGASVEFVVSAPPHVLDRIRQSEHSVSVLEDAARRAWLSEPSRVWTDVEQSMDAHKIANMLGTDFDIVVVDHYGLGAVWEACFAGRSRVLAIDDLANRPHEAQLVTDQNWYGPGSSQRYADLVHSDAVQLLGPRYAILQRAYQRLVRPSPVRFPPTSILVSFGGTDPGGETEKVLTAVADSAFDSLTVDVVVGSPQRVTDEMNSLVAGRRGTQLHVAVPTLAPLLSTADLAVGASGAATWERFAAGVPALVTTVAPHQSGVTEQLHQFGVTRWVGLTDDTTPSTYRSELQRAMKSQNAWAPRVVDGFGAARLAEALIPSQADALARRPLEMGDAGAILGLEAEDAGQPESAHGLLGGPPAWQSEERRFDEMLFDAKEGSADENPTLIEASGVPVAATGIPTVSGRCSRHTLIQSCVTSEALQRSIRRDS